MVTGPHESMPPRSANGTARPPESFQDLYGEVLTCSKCGFCQPACPVFRATGREANVARGKVTLFRDITEGTLELTPAVKEAFANCLLCRACTESCVQGVRTDEVVVSFRHAYAERFGRGFLQRLVFRTLLPRPRLMGFLVGMVWAFRKTGLVDAARRAGLVGLLNPKLERALELGTEKPGPLLRKRLATRARLASRAHPGTRARPGTRSRLWGRTLPGGRGGAGASVQPTVGYWISCGYNYVLPEVGEATVRVLERMGYRVEVLDNCCCGAAAYGYGDLTSAAHLARENLRRIGDPERFEAIVSECGSCSGQLKDYPRLLADDPEWQERAETLKSKARSFSEFVAEHGGLQSPAAEGQGVTPATVTFHDPCHLGRRYQNVVEQPRLILRSLPGVNVVELEESDSCCGAAGTYGVTHPETSASILDRKMGFIQATGASVVATECPACMMQLKLGAQKAGLPVTVLGISQVCDQATGPSPARPEG